ncbi:alcohol oxidase [Pleurotus eryngii]|uniref:Alcohol oxidase n=1 Tax=Pleurotus eryngii TaxID=5323 RepID=A0A9P5ZV06_PLEER|nr:alcohol oxidase [Pleurotus eryngii]
MYVIFKLCCPDAGCLTFLLVLFGRVLGNSSFDWNFISVPQTWLGNRVIGFPRGKMLGGSSGVNFMVFGRGPSDEYNAWASLGNPGWDWNGLMSYFKKSETVPPGDANLHERWCICTIHPDPDSGNATGIFQSPRSVDPKGIRPYSASAYFSQEQSRSNLLVLTGAEAKKILLTKYGNNLVATGVTFTSGGKSLTAKANKEVIPSTSSIKTPQLLELSGTDQKALLTKLRIPVLQDLPEVGENFQVAFDLLSLHIEPAPFTRDQVVNNATFNDEQLALYAKTGSGPYAASGGLFSFEPLQAVLPRSQVTTILAQLDKEIKSTKATALRAAQYPIQRKLITDGRVGQIEFSFLPGGPTVANRLPDRSYISMTALSPRPFSCGSVHINSTTPTASPIIDPNYFAFTFDSQLLTSAASTPPENAADDGFASFSQQASWSVFHPCGTAALAPKSSGGVVDTNLKVYGTNNLMIVDASVMPLVFAAHMQGTVYAIAEKAADIVKKANNL